MEFSKITGVGIIAVLLLEPASANLLSFTPSIQPNPVTLTCEASKTANDVYHMPVDDAGRFRKLTPGKHLTTGVQFVADSLSKLEKAGYRSRGGIKKDSNGNKYKELTRKIKVTTRIGIKLSLNIKADRSGVQTSVSGADIQNPTVSLEPPVSNLITKKSAEIIERKIKEKTRQQVAEMTAVGKQMDGFHFDYDPAQAVFDQANSGVITRQIPVSYCGKTRHFRVRVEWRRSIDRPLGDGAADW